MTLTYHERSRTQKLSQRTSLRSTNSIKSALRDTNDKGVEQANKILGITSITYEH